MCACVHPRASAGISVIEAVRFWSEKEKRRGKNKRGGENWGWERQTERTAVGERREAQQREEREREREKVEGRAKSRKGERAERGGQSKRGGCAERSRSSEGWGEGRRSRGRAGQPAPAIRDPRALKAPGSAARRRWPRGWRGALGLHRAQVLAREVRGAPGWGGARPAGTMAAAAAGGREVAAPRGSERAAGCALATRAGGP